MATNPMQRKARNSFILGVLITFVLMAMVVGVLLVQLKNMKEEEVAREAKNIQVCVLTADVTSGQIITEDIIKTITVDKTTVPADATSQYVTMTDFFREDKEGNPVVTGTDDKTYLQRSDAIYELFEEDATGEYYIVVNNNKEYIELTTPPLIARIDMKANTVLTSSMLVASDETTTDDLRLQEYNMIQLSSQIATDDYIDIRLRMPTGEDYIVVSKKKVEMPQVNGYDSENTIWLKLTEDEILTMSSAIVENYIIEGSLLYTSKYVEPGSQAKSETTYVPSAEVQYLMRDNDSNILETAKSALIIKYNSNSAVRSTIDSAKSAVEDDEKTSSVESGVQEEITKAQEQRQSYLDELAGN